MHNPATASPSFHLLSFFLPSLSSCPISRAPPPKKEEEEEEEEEEE